MVYKNDQANQYRNWERTYNVSLTDVAKRNLRAYMYQELNYYNTLVKELNSKVRVLYNEIESIKDQNERIWLAVAQTAVDLRVLAKESIDAWPEILKPYATYIVNNNKLTISDRMMMLFDIAATKAVLHPLIRRSIAAEVLHWIQPQATQIAESDSNSTGQMRNALQMLQPTEYAFKRHVQLTNEIVDFSYDNDSKSTTITIPYLPQPIVIEGQDLTKMPHDHIIIRQKPGVVPNEDTPWQITVREGTGRYLLDVTDMSYIPRKRR